MNFRHDGKPIGRNAKLRRVRFAYWKTETEPSDSFPQTATLECILFSDLQVTLLVGQQEGHLASENDPVILEGPKLE